MPETVRTRRDGGAGQLCRDDVDWARHGLAGRTLVTPVVRGHELERDRGPRLWLKTENLQRGGSFKLRGALLATDRVAAAGCRGVVAQSTGNHGIAVALAARDHGLPAVVVVPEDVARTKVDRLRAAGAELVTAGRLLADRVAVTEDLRRARGLAIIDPYEDPDVVLGQGTASAELITQVETAGARLDALVVPVGGGRAAAGACLAADGGPAHVVAAEPAAVPALSAAVRAGVPVTVATRATIADGLRPDRVGALPFALVGSRIGGVEVVDESRIELAMRDALLRARLLVEPAAATALAVAMLLPADRYRDVGVLLTGGNVDAPTVSAALSLTEPAVPPAPSRSTASGGP